MLFAVWFAAGEAAEDQRARRGRHLEAPPDPVYGERRAAP